MDWRVLMRFPALRSSRDGRVSLPILVWSVQGEAHASGVECAEQDAHDFLDPYGFRPWRFPVAWEK
jgi:hypothetical protein